MQEVFLWEKKVWWENTSIFSTLTSNKKAKILASILLLKTSPSNKNPQEH